MITAQEIEVAKLIVGAGVELIRIAGEWIATGKRPDPKRVEEVWSTLEQARAKLETDRAADERYGPRETDELVDPFPRQPIDASAPTVPPNPFEGER
jgi:hypothetical protein